MNKRIKDFEKKCWNNQTNHLDAEKFAELVRADERKACVKVCYDLALPPYVERGDKTIWEMATLDCAYAIQARGET